MRIRQLVRTSELSMRPGVTLVEVAVSLAVVLILATLFLPAIQSSSSAARAVTCRARMQQLGVAVQNFESRHRYYPHGAGVFSWHVSLLPDLDCGVPYRELILLANDSLAAQPIVRKSSLAVLQCPSDPSSARWEWAINFVLNAGSTFGGLEEDDSHAFYYYMPPLSSANVTDGLSNTAYVSERLNTDLATTHDRRAFWKTPIGYYLPNQVDDFANLCESMPINAIGPPQHMGQLSLIDGISRYDHIVNPNRASCRNFTANYSFAAFTANSEHQGGVNVLMADGAVRFISNEISRQTWRALGTRNGHEVVSVP